MSATEQQIIAWAATTRPRNWRNFCQAFIYNICDRFGTANVIYPSATAARLDSRIRSTDMSSAPASAIHYWDYWATIGGRYANYGHVGLDTRGGGFGVMSSGRGIPIGNGAALVSFSEWQRSMGNAVTYRGWSLSNGQNSVTVTTSGSASGGGNKPINKKGFLMALTDNEQELLLNQVSAIFSAIYGTKNVGSNEPIRWTNVDGPRESNYGLLDIDLWTQQLAARAAQDAAKAADKP